MTVVNILFENNYLHLRDTTMTIHPICFFFKIFASDSSDVLCKLTNNSVITITPKCHHADDGSVYTTSNKELTINK